MTDLDLSYNGFGAISGAVIGRSLISHPSLVRLSLSRNKLGDDGVEGFCLALGDRVAVQGGIFVDFSGNGVGAHGASSLARCAASLSRPLGGVSLAENQVGDAGVGLLVPGLAVLRELDLSGAHVMATGVVAIGNGLVRGPGPWALTRLALSRATFDDAACAAIVSALESPKCMLQALDVRGSWVSVKGLNLLAQSLKKNRSLLELDLSGTGFSDCASLAQALRTNTTLTSLQLNGSTEEKSSQAIEGVLDAALEMVGVRAFVTDEGAKLLAEALVANTALQTISLSYNSISAAGCKLIAEALVANKGLTRLDLSSNSIHHSGDLGFGAALAANRTLTWLSLSSNPIGTEGAQAILKAPSALQELYLSRCRISDPDGLPFDSPAAALSHMPATLRVLDVRDNKVKTVGSAILHCAAMEKLYSSGNPWGSPPASVLAQGLGAVKDYVAKMAQEGSEVCKMCKLMLVGLGEAGKTSLLNALLDEENSRSAPIARENRTVGIEIRRWRPSMAALRAGLQANKEAVDRLADLQVQVCDFAGQREYTVSHLLFLSEQAVYALVFDVSNFEASRMSVIAEQWLDAIACKSPGARVLLVATHCDMHDKDEVDRRCEVFAEGIVARLAHMQRAVMLFDQEDADEPQPQAQPLQGQHTRDLAEKMRAARGRVHDASPLVHGLMSLFQHRTGQRATPTTKFGSAVLRVSCLDGQGVPAARSAILAAVSQLERVGFTMPKSYAVARGFFESQAGLPGSVVSKVPDLFDRAATVSSLSAEAFREAVSFWHDQGLIYHHGPSDLVFPDPGHVLDLVRTVVVHKTELLRRALLATSEAARAGLFRLATEALLTEDVLHRHLWADMEVSFPKAVWPGLVGVLESFGVLSPLSGGGGAGGGGGDADWLVPALLDERETPVITAISMKAGLLVRRFVFPFTPFGALITNLHTELAAEDRVSSKLSSSWGLLRLPSLAAAGADSALTPSALYKMEPLGASVFPLAQFDMATVGLNALDPDHVRYVLTVEANSAAALNVVLEAVQRLVLLYPGLRRLVKQLIPTGLGGERGDSSGAGAIHAIVPRDDTGRADGVVASRRATTKPFPGFGGQTLKFSELERSPPPTVFLSYQWDVQREVLALKRVLESCLHLSCWLDLERLEAGDNLESKMVEGVTDAELVVVCLTKKYLVDAPNALFEFTTARRLNKRIVVVMLESLPGVRVLDASEEAVAGFDDRLKAQWADLQTWPRDKRDLLRVISSMFYVYAKGRLLQDQEGSAPVVDPALVAELEKAVGNAFATAEARDAQDARDLEVAKLKAEIKRQEQLLLEKDREIARLRSLTAPPPLPPPTTATTTTPSPPKKKPGELKKKGNSLITNARNFLGTLAGKSLNPTTPTATTTLPAMTSITATSINKRK